MRLKQIRELFQHRDQAMARARRCRAEGLSGVEIARRANRLALRTLRMGD